MSVNARVGLIWWESLNVDEQLAMLRRARAFLRRPASGADCWALWRAGQIKMGAGVGSTPVSPDTEVPGVALVSFSDRNPVGRDVRREGGPQQATPGVRTLSTASAEVRP